MNTNQIGIHGRIKELLKEIKVRHYNEPNKASDQQAMGILMSIYFSFDGVSILKATSEGLEDSNFHKENEVVIQLLNKLEGK